MSLFNRTFIHIQRDRLSEDQSGAVLVVFAGCLFGILALLGLAVDSGTLFRTRVILQTSLDTAVMAGARVIATDGTDNAAQQRAITAARLAMQANLRINGFPASEISKINSPTNFDAALDIPGNNLPPRFRAFVNKIEVSSIMMRLVKMVGIEKLSVGANSEALIRPANVYVLLDTSKSMICPPNSTGACGCGLEGGPGAPACTYANSKQRLVNESIMTFVENFDETNDRVGLIAYNTGASIRVRTRANQGFSKAEIQTAINNLTNPTGYTNQCDALHLAYEDLKSRNAERNAAYVLFTDGSPTAGRFQFANAPGLGGSHFFWDSFVDCPTGTTADNQPIIVKGFLPSKLVNARSFQTLAGTSDISSSVYDFNASDEADFCNNYDCAACGRNINCIDIYGANSTETLPPSDPRRVDRMRACMNDVSFSTEGFGEPWNSNQNKYQTGSQFNGPSDDFEWSFSVSRGAQWRQMFYDCAIAFSDTIRESGGSLYVVAVGPEGNTATADPYQDIDDRQSRKDRFLRRIAYDDCAATTPNVLGIAPDPNFFGFLNFGEMNARGHREGVYLPTDGNPGQLEKDLQTFFDIIASKIKWRLSG